MADVDTVEGGDTSSAASDTSWKDLVKTYGEKRARQLSPELDPKYQKLVAEEGQAKGSADYAEQYMDPSTVTARGWGGFGSNAEYQQGVQALQDKSGLPKLVGDVASLMPGDSTGTGAGIKDWFTGNAPPPDPSKTVKKPPDPSKTTTPAATMPVPPAEQMLNGLASQYQAAMAEINPYISGQLSAPANAQASAYGAQVAAGGGAAGAEETQIAGTQSALNQAEAAYGKANAAGEQGIVEALKGTGVANQEALAVDPYLSILNALTSEAQYKTETGTPTFTTSKLPAAVEAAYQATIGESAPGTSVPGSSTTTQPATSSTSPSSDNPDSPDQGG